jgi:hypothetical protein
MSRKFPANIFIKALLIMTLASPQSSSAAEVCDRTCLYGVLDSYLAALAARDPKRLPLARDYKFTENNVALEIGDGLWGTLTALGDYDLRFADPVNGAVGFFGTVTETRDVSAFALRLKVVDRRIVEIESLIARQADEGFKFEQQKFEHKPVLNEIIPPGERLDRDGMIRLADGYFDTLQRNDGTLRTMFHTDCNRVENGVQSTNNPDFPQVPVARLSCEAQFRLGNYRYDDRLRARRYLLVDEERGLVLAAGFIDHEGRLGEYTLTDGTALSSPIRRPHSYYLLELFKIRDGAIQQIEANFMTVPYRMPSPWGP